MIKLLLVNKLFEPVTGGVETVVGQIAKGMAADPEFDVTVLAGNEKAFDGTQFYAWHNASIIKTASAGTIYNTALSPAYLYWLKKLAASSDIIHFHVPNPLAEIACRVFALPVTAKIIVTLHADISQTTKKHFAVPYNYLLRKLLRRANVITTMSANNLNTSPVLEGFLHKCVIIPNAYDETLVPDVTKQKKEDFLNRYELDSDKPIILFTGRLSKSKGLEYLLDAVSTLKNVQLLICGDGPLKTEISLKAKNNPNKVVLTGNLQSDMLSCAYRVAQVFVLPSINETFGIVQAEALRFGLPVINTNLGTGVNTVSIHNETGLTVHPANAPALAEAMAKILYDTALATRFSEAALLRSALFAPDKMIASFRQLYTDGISDIS